MKTPPGLLDREELEARDLDLNVVRRLWGYVWPFRTALAAGLLLMIVSSAAALAGPYLAKVAIDDHIVAGDPAGLGNVVLLFIGAHMAAWLSSFGNTYLTAWIGQHVIAGLRRDLLSHTLRLSFRFYDRFQTGRLLSRLTHDVNAMSEVLSSGIVQAFGDVLILTGTVAVMFSINAPLAAASLSVFPPLIVAVLLFRIRARRAYHKVRRRIAVINADLAESISGVRVVQSFTREERNREDFRRINDLNFEANMEAAAAHSIFIPVVEFLAAAATALVIWYGGGQILQGRLTTGELFAFLLYLARFFSPVRELSHFYSMLQGAIVSGQRVFEILDQDLEITEKPGALPAPEHPVPVAFDRVTFGYDPSRPVLTGLSLEIDAGRTAAVVGATGAGKTTLASLLCRFYDPGEGRILLGGVDLRELSLPSLRRSVGIILQDTFLFSGTVEENIAYGRPEASPGEIREAAAAVGATAFIEALPAGWRTEVGERGTRLSAGQRQLIGFARALLKNPPLLILDEATSSVDLATEKTILGAVEALRRGRTTLIIAHRLATVHGADVVFVLDQGRLVEQGKHEELIAREGTYHRLYHRQLSAG